MRKKYIVSLLIPALLIQFCGCYSMNEITKDDLAGLKDGGDLIVLTKDPAIYSFKEYNYHISADSLHGKGYVKYSEDSDFNVEIEKSIALRNIESIQQDELNVANTTLLIIGGVALIAGVGLLIEIANALSVH